MRIVCKTTFLDGTRRFETGDVVTVDDSLGAKFLAHGWVSELTVTGEPGSESTDLNVQNGTLGQNTSIGV